VTVVAKVKTSHYSRKQQLLNHQDSFLTIFFSPFLNLLSSSSSFAAHFQQLPAIAFSTSLSVMLLSVAVVGY
jgi:hypothetical protein